jgi:riboflavin transporter FmnP
MMFMQNNTKNLKLRKVILCAVFAALAYVAMMTVKIPVVLFLKYEPKDVIIALAAFIAGPLSGISIALVTCLVEFVSVSDTGVIGFLMNFISSACYAGVASLIYLKIRTVKGAVAGLACATLATTGFMILWNYIVTPWYMHVPRDVVAEMLVPTFLPFNLLKYSLNSALAMLLYKPVSKAVKRAGFRNMLPTKADNMVTQNGSLRISLGVAVVSLVVIASCIMLMLVLAGKI